MKKLILFLGILGWMLLKGQEVMSQYQTLGEITDFKLEKNGLLLTCDSELLRVEFITPAIIRLRVARNGVWDNSPAYALAKTDWRGAEFQFTDTEMGYHLRSRVVEVRIQKNPCRLSFYDLQGQLLNQDDPALGMAWEGSEVAVFKKLFADERFFGLGEKAGALERRGREYYLWNSDIPAYTDQTDPLYQSHPFFMGLRDRQAYGIFFNNTYRSVFNLGAGNHRLYYFRADNGPLDYFFIAGPTTKDVITHYSELVGRMPLPPLWALGYQQCRWSYFPESEVRSLAETFRTKKIPADVIYLDIHYMQGYRCFTFDAERFPQPEKLLRDLKAQGFQVVTIVDPGIKVDPGYHVYESGLAGDHFIKYPDGEPFIGDVWPGPCHFANFTRPETRQWWRELVQQFAARGVAGIWNDMNEPAVWGREMPLVVEFDEQGQKVNLKKIHNIFGHLMAEATYQGLLQARPNERPFILTRAGFSGTQRFAASWTGDNISSEDHLELAIRLCQSMGLSGIPFVGADVGGFIGTPSTELFIRWIQAGAFTPFYRNHSAINTRDQEPWSFGEDAETLVRQYIELRYRWLPYNYTLFNEAAETGLPMMRPLFLEFPDEAETYVAANHLTYLWGDKILVAPVTRPQTSCRSVYLPAGTWYDFWENKTYSGGQYIYVDTPLHRLPLFVRAGAVIPLRPVQQYVTEQPLTLLELHVYPGARLTNILYEDDGHSLDYQQGIWAKTQFTVETNARGATKLNLATRTGQYQPGKRDFQIVIHGQSKLPTQFWVNGKKISLSQLTFDEKEVTITVLLGDTGQAQEVVLGE